MLTAHKMNFASHCIASWLQVNYDDVSITENTRASYPIEHIANARLPCTGPHPKNIILLCCDAFGVLPPVARLTHAQAMYHFISGYTAKVAGTEVGVTEPSATFSACFGGAFLMWHPMKYAAMLAERMRAHGAGAWLVNTGWTGGAYGAGSRMSLKHTRAIVDAIHSGELSKSETTRMPTFGLRVPTKVTGVPERVLAPRSTWADGAAYDAALAKLARLFRDNMAQYSDTDYVAAELVEEILSAGPDSERVSMGGGVYSRSASTGGLKSGCGEEGRGASCAAAADAALKVPRLDRVASKQGLA